MRGIAWLALACLGSSGLSATQAMAQVEAPTGSRIGRTAGAYVPENSLMSDADRGRATLYGFSDCTVAHSTKDARAAVEQPYGDWSVFAKLAGPQFSQCINNGEIKFPFNLWRGALFRSLYAVDFGKKKWQLPEKPTDYARFVSNPAVGGAYFPLIAFADCVVRKDLANSRAFVLAGVATGAENRALEAISPSFGPCLTNGLTVSFNKSSIAALLAEALYREAQDAAAQSAVQAATEPATRGGG